MSRLRFLKSKYIWIPLGLILVAAFVASFFAEEAPTTNLAFSEVIAAGRDGKLQSVAVDGKNLVVRMRGDNVDYRSRIDSGTDVVRALQEGGATVGGTGAGAVTVEYKGTSTVSAWFGIGLWVFSFLLFGGVVYVAVLFATRRARKQS